MHHFLGTHTTNHGLPKNQVLVLGLKIAEGVPVGSREYQPYKCLFGSLETYEGKQDILNIYLFSLEANYFTILWWLLPHVDMNQLLVLMCPPVLNPLPPPFSPHPSGLPQSTGFGYPASCTELGLVIYFT